MSETVKSPLEMFYHWERTTPNKVFLRQPAALQWAEYTWAQVADQVRRVASFIRAQGYPAGSSIGIWSGNSKDWAVVDLAIMLSGHVSVPLYPGQDPASARYIFEHAACRMLFLGSSDLGDQADEVIPAELRRVAMLGCSARTQTTLAQVIADHPPFAESPIPDPQAIFTMLYTSGTTGNPKGVMHAHSTPGHVVPDMLKSFGLPEGSTSYFSFLPMAHAAERIAVELCCLYINGSISFSEGLATFGDELRSVQPTFFFAVPRLWVKFKEGVDAKIPPAAQASLTEDQKAGLRKQLGLSTARFILTGSAPCPRDVAQWFTDMGMWLREGYGMTENFIHGCAWIAPDQAPIPGCVGKPLGPGVEVRISDADEILFRSKGLMKGYYKEPEKTAEVLVDGWYHSGDSGRIDADGNLWVTGRISEVFKTSKGKFIKPVALEARFARSGLLGQFCIFGHGYDQPVLLASLSEAAKKLSRAELAAQLATLQSEVNAELLTHERVQQMFVTQHEWQIGNGLLTPTMKLKRKALEGRYRAWVETWIGKEPVVFE